ncbi:MAG: hypothetical protein II031_00460, partial [Bacteroidales bacterium]|nr:hypothetical protein [Bacteroidales bacterium]
MAGKAETLFPGSGKHGGLETIFSLLQPETPLFARSKHIRIILGREKPGRIQFPVPVLGQGILVSISPDHTETISVVMPLRGAETPDEQMVTMAAVTVWTRYSIHRGYSIPRLG